jgi:hypothetical protein
MKKIVTGTFCALACAMAISANVHAADNSLNGVWLLDSATCKGEGQAVDEMNTDLQRIIPAELQQVFIIDGATGSFMSNDPQPNDPCVILVQGTVSTTDTEVSLTPKYPVSIGAGRCKIDGAGSAGVKFKRNGAALEFAGSDNKNVCKEIVYTYTKMGASN